MVLLHCCERFENVVGEKKEFFSRSRDASASREFLFLEDEMQLHEVQSETFSFLNNFQR